MRIRKLIAVTAALLLTVLAGSGTAEGGVTLRTISCFAGLDGSAEEYVAILQHYESMTGNTVIDNSAVIDEAWKTDVLKDFAAGNEPDILFFFAAGADSAPILSRVVSLEEINTAYPDMNLPENDILREPDGKVYAVPVRGYWEGLYVHTDLFEQYGAPLPKTFEEVPASWLEAMSLIRELAEAGAFADNAWSTYESATTNLFLEKKAAMQMDGSWIQSSFTYGMMDTLRVLPMPLHNGEGTADCYVGGVSMGFYLTRRAWESGRRDAAVALLQELTSEESIAELGSSTLSGRLLDSAKDMQAGRQMVSPLQDAMNIKAREVWLLECIPAVAEGTMTPEECWRRVMSLAPFAE